MKRMTLETLHHLRTGEQVFNKILYKNKKLKLYNQNHLYSLFENLFISTYIINLPVRKERLKSICKEFNGRSEFCIKVVKACKHHIGAVGLWFSIQKVISKAIENDDDVIIVCEDDHQFTSFYNKEYLFKNIIEANMQKCDILLGGISGGFSCIMPISENRFWIDGYWCNQFIIIFKRFFSVILKHTFDEKKKVDETISSLTPYKMVLYPFISVQKFFGYSDVTIFNHQNHKWANERFSLASERLESIQSIYQYFMRDNVS